MLFEGLDLDRCVLSHGGYTGNFTLLYGVALGASTMCSEPSSPQQGEAPSPALRNEIRSQACPTGLPLQRKHRLWSVTHVPY